MWLLDVIKYHQAARTVMQRGTQNGCRKWGLKNIEVDLN
jgi:hypothetical protein